MYASRVSTLDDRTALLAFGVLRFSVLVAFWLIRWVHKCANGTSEKFLLAKNTPAPKPKPSGSQPDTKGLIIPDSAIADSTKLST